MSVQPASTTVMRAFKDDDWQHQTQQSGQIPLQADRWWTDLGAEGGEDPDYGRCLGIRCNSWAQVQWQRDVTHHLLGDGTSNIIGWGALRWQGMIGTDKVLFGKHSKL